MVLGGQVNKSIINPINQNWRSCDGLTGKDGNPDPRPQTLYRSESDGSSERIDIRACRRSGRHQDGCAGAVHVQRLYSRIAPIGVGDEGEAYNINADLVAGRLPRR